MIRRLAICLEELDPAGGRFIQCVALRDEEPGLSIDAEGEIQWQASPPSGCRLQVDEHARLMITRVDETPARLERAGRALELPPDTPTPVLSFDELAVGARRYRIHVHEGEAPEALPPTPLSRPPFLSPQMREVAVRTTPPKPPGGVIPGTGAVGNLILLLVVLAGVVVGVLYWFVW